MNISTENNAAKNLQPVVHSYFEIQIMNRGQIERTAPNFEHILISIESPYLPAVVLPDCGSRMAYLKLNFDDYTYGHRDQIPLVELSSYGTPVFFSSEHAQQIVQFVNDHGSKSRVIICQCNGGLSRSPAIGRALFEHLNPSEAIPDHLIRGNQLVYDLLKESLIANRKKAE